MLQFVWNKIKNKKWLNLCLLVGISFLTALFACHPMFEKGAANQVLQMSFQNFAKEQEEFPAIMSRKETCDIADYPDVSSVYQQMEAYENKWIHYVDTDRIASQKYISLSGSNADTSLGGKNYFFSIGLLSDMEKYIEMVQGQKLDDTTETTGVFPCIISESTMDAYGLVIGEQLEFSAMVNNSGNPVRFEITGICTESDIQDNYWRHPLSYFGEHIFVSENTLNTLMQEYGQETIQYEENILLDYMQITADNAADYASYIEQFRKADPTFTDNLSELLENFALEKKTVRMTLWALEVPCIVLLLLFIYMVSSQILTSEEGEIAVLRSRGATRFQTILLYLLQSGILVLTGMVIGIGLGYGMCKGAASTDAFLKFVKKDVSMYRFTWEVIPYGLVGGVIVVLFMTLPVWKRSNVTIVEQKSKNQYSGKSPFWERYFLDVILAGLSGYLLYNFNKQQDSIAMSVITQENIDTMMLLDTSLFIFACGLLFLRLCRYLILFVNYIGEKYWKPARYVSFLQLKRTWYKQGFLAVFLIMTIASGIFDANMARTMNNNLEERIKYNIGADIQMKEKWKFQFFIDPVGSFHWEYTEPDYEIYAELMKQGMCRSITNVIEDNNTEVKGKNRKVEQAQLLGIQTKEFGETAHLLDGLNEKHWFYALNALAAEPEGVIISKNLAERLKLKVGDSLEYSRYYPIPSKESEKLGTVNAKVCAILECFPGYEQYTYERNQEDAIVEHENYLIVGNYATIVSEFQLTPYSVWMSLADGKTDEEVRNYLAKKNITCESWQSAPEQISQSRNSAMVQVTNGMFTLSFIISLIICSIGFLIYWIMSIKNRELLFGIYRAMGMGRKEINQMLINEQIFSSLLAIITGGGVGALATWLFVRLIALIYLPEKHNISIQIYIYASDLIKLAVVILAVVLVCGMILRLLLRNMKIAQALRLGED